MMNLSIYNLRVKERADEGVEIQQPNHMLIIAAALREIQTERAEWCREDCKPCVYMRI